MNTAKMIQCAVFVGYVIMLFMGFTGRPGVLHAQWFEELTEDQQHAIKEDIQEAIRRATALSSTGKYADALRVLFDMMYKEQRTWPSPPSPSASTEKNHLITSLVRQDQSPLMQLFRDPDIPLQEKLTYIDELQALVMQDELHDEEVRFRGKYHGTLIQLLNSPKLSQDEKFDILFWIENTIQGEYTSEAQWSQLREEIVQLRRLADQKLQDQQYVEAVVLIHEAIKKVQGIPPSEIGEDYLNLLEQKSHITESFVQSDESPLMQQLKSWLISYRKKRHLLTELETILAKDSTRMPEKVIFQGKEYDGPLMQILSHPEISWTTKHKIVEYLKKVIKKYSLLP